MNDEGAPEELRDGVRAGIVAVLKGDVEKRGARTARLLVAAGAIGVLGAVGVTLMVARHPFGHHPPSHLVVFTAVWSGLLVVSLALVFLQVRTPSLPLAHAAGVGLLGLGAAGICGALCPNPHFLVWWSGTRLGGALSRIGGLELSSLCFGVTTTAVVAAVSALVVFVGRERRPTSPHLPASMLVALLVPGVALQSVGNSWGVFSSWLIGTVVGAWVGVSAGLRIRSHLGTRSM
jgi:hypothetical protein